MRKTADVHIQICRENAIKPFYARPGDAGMDVCSAVELSLAPGETGIVWTGLKFAVPPGYELQVRPRSGISLNTPLRLSNSPGTIDSGYRGELGIILTNTSAPASGSGGPVNTADEKGNAQGTYLIRPGDRVAQLVLAEVPEMRLIETDDVAAIGVDRKGGFGSTGTAQGQGRKQNDG